MDEHQREEYLRIAYRAAGQEWRAINEAAHRPSPDDLAAAWTAPATPRSRHSPGRPWTVTRPTPSPSARPRARTTRAGCPPATRNTT